MEQAGSAIIIAMVIIFIFIPSFYLKTVSANSKTVNRALSLSVRALEESVINSGDASEDIALGYDFSDDPIMRIKIDEGKLLLNFEDILYKNLNNAKKFNRIQDNILCKILIYPDRYVVLDNTTYAAQKSGDQYLMNTEYYNYGDEVNNYKSGKKDIVVTAPKYFVYSYSTPSTNGGVGTFSPQSIYADPGRPAGINPPSGFYYINTVNTRVKYLNTKSEGWKTGTYEISHLRGRKFDKQTGNLSGTTDKLSEFDKNQSIINALNTEIKSRTKGVGVNFNNPANEYKNNKAKVAPKFDLFSGITFLVIYRERGYLSFKDSGVSFSRYNVVGYTLTN